MSHPDTAPRCAYCGATAPGVRLDPQLDIYQCHWCWVRTYPHAPPRPPQGWRYEGDCESAA